MSPMVRKLLAAAALALLVLVWFGNIQYRDLFQPDEGRYAEIPREMVASGDWLTPRLDGYKYFEKPPLQYWATAAAYTAFGRHNWTARLWSYLTGFGAIVLVAVAGGLLFGAPAGWCAALVLASSLYYGAVAHINSLDTGVSFFMTATLVGFLLAQRESLSERRRRLWMLSAWVAMGLAVLSKGLIGVVLPGGALVLYCLLRRDWRIWRRLHLGAGLPALALVTVPWFALVCRKNPEFFHFFFIREHIERFLTTIHKRYEPWWYFLPILLAGSLPWLSGLLRALFRGWRRSEPRDRFDPTSFSWCWVVTILVFFSLSDSKLIPYILPAFPALALLIGRELPSWEKGLRWEARISGAFSVLGLAFLLFVGLERFGSSKKPAYLWAALSPWVAVGLLVVLLGALAAWFWLRRSRTGAAIGALGVAWLVAVALWMTGLQGMAPAYSSHEMARKVGGAIPADVPFYSVDTYYQTVPFYFDRTPTLVGYTGELAFGIKQAPQQWVPTIEEFARRWRTDSAAWAVMPPKVFNRLQREQLPMREVARDPQRVLVTKP